MMKTFIKYVLVFFTMISIMTIIGLEMNFDIKNYLISYILVAILFYCFLLYYDFFKFINIIIPLIILLSIIPTYILTYSIIMLETDIAFKKIQSIPKKSLIEYYQKKDIDKIPKNCQRTWIGIRYRQIGVVNKNRNGKINAIGWKGNSVFAYYKLTEDEYYGSYHWDINYIKKTLHNSNNFQNHPE